LIFHFSLSLPLYINQHCHYDFLMKIKLPYYLSALLLLVTFLQGCRKENYDVIDPEKEVFNFIVTEPQRQYINASRGEQYEITDPLPELQFAGNVYTIDRFEIRGDNTLNFTRKGFGVNMDKKITLINSEEQTERKYEEFKLLAMVYDYT
jgi:lipocalin